MIENQYIGAGHNPRGLDLPVGFSMKLAQEPAAMERFTALEQEQKDELVRYMQAAVNGDDSEFRVMDTIRKLREHLY